MTNMLRYSSVQNPFDATSSTRYRDASSHGVWTVSVKAVVGPQKPLLGERPQSAEPTPASPKLGNANV